MGQFSSSVDTAADTVGQIEVLLPFNIDHGILKDPYWQGKVGFTEHLPSHQLDLMKFEI